MKQRWGFVSNSSSSSFILAVRKGHSLQDMILPDQDSLFWAMAKRLYHFLPHRLYEDPLVYAGDHNDRWEPHTEASVEASLQDVIGDDWRDWQFATFDASSEGEAVEQMIYEGALTCKTRNLILQEGSL